MPRRLHRAWIAIVLAGFGAGAPAADDPVKLEPSDDTFLTPEHTGKPAGRGKKDELQLYGTGTETTHRVLLRFDLKAVPPGFRAAILELNCWNGHWKAERSSHIGAFMLTRPWGEDTTSWDISTGGKWSDPGGSWDPKPVSGCRLFGPLGGEKNRQFYWDLTAVARRWQAQPGQNYGVALIMAKDCDAELRFRSKDVNDAAQRPHLLLYYKSEPDKRAMIMDPKEVPPFEPYDPLAPSIKLRAMVDTLRLNQDFEVKFEAEGGTPPYRFGPASPPVPGLQLLPDGTWKGKPSRAGTYVVGTACVAGNKKATDWRSVTVVDPNAKPPEPPKEEPAKKDEPKPPEKKDPEEKQPDKPKQPVLIDEE